MRCGEVVTAVSSGPRGIRKRTRVLRSPQGELPGSLNEDWRKPTVCGLEPGAAWKGEERKNGVKWFPDPDDHSEISCGGEPPSPRAPISSSGKQERGRFA